MCWIVVSSLHSCNLCPALPCLAALCSSYRDRMQSHGARTRTGLQVTRKQPKIELCRPSFNVEKMPKLWVWSNEWQIKYDPSWAGPSAWGGLYPSLLHRLCLRPLRTGMGMGTDGGSWQQPKCSNISDPPLVYSSSGSTCAAPVGRGVAWGWVCWHYSH